VVYATSVPDFGVSDSLVSDAYIGTNRPNFPHFGLGGMLAEVPERIAAHDCVGSEYILGKPGVENGQAISACGWQPAPDTTGSGAQDHGQYAIAELSLGLTQKQTENITK
jgi:hypothetical protein